MSNLSLVKDGHSTDQLTRETTSNTFIVRRQGRKPFKDVTWGSKGEMPFGSVAQRHQSYLSIQF
jgi:hypothetical protein